MDTQFPVFPESSIRELYRKKDPGTLEDGVHGARTRQEPELRANEGNKKGNSGSFPHLRLTRKRRTEKTEPEPGRPIGISC